MPVDGALPPWISVDDVQSRLEAIFAPSFPDRTLLVGRMAARVVFEFLYGGCIETRGRYLRPSQVYLFTDDQAALKVDAQRIGWYEGSWRSGHRAPGRRWYADTSREPIRDDLMRTRLLRLGIIGRRADIVVPTTSSNPVYFMAAGFAALFDPQLVGDALRRTVDTWRAANLDPDSLSRMRLRAQGLLPTDHDVLIDMPDGTRTRIAGGPSALITKALIERFAPAALAQPAVLWISASDRKAQPDFVQRSAVIGLRFDLQAELPDLILADLARPLRIVFCEVVATDGAMTSARKDALLRIVASSDVPPAAVHFLTAFEDRSGAAFRRNFSLLAPDTGIWFRSEPDLLVEIRTLGSRR